MSTISNCKEALPSLRAGAAALGLQLDAKQFELCVRYCELVREANAHMNLTALREPQNLMNGLILDSIALAALLPELDRSAAVMDVGSGSGVPGIPLKIVHPDWSVTLLESIGKKARFLEDAVQTLNLRYVSVVNARAEEAAWDSAFRDGADLCVARAVAPLPTLIELCAPFVKHGGWLAFPKGAGVRDEITGADQAAQTLRVRLVAVKAVMAEIGLGNQRSVVLYEKVAPTPEGYPRRVGLAKSRPM